MNRDMKRMLSQLFGSGSTQPLRGKQLRREIRASSNLAYGPQLRELDRQRRISREHQRRTKSYFKDYNNAIQAAAQNTQNAYANAQQQQVDAASAIMGQNSQALGALNAERQAAAAKFGAQPRFAPIDTLAAAQTNLGTQQTADAASLGRMGVAAQQSANDQSRIATGARNDALMQEMARRRAINDERRDVKREKGQYAAAKRTELRGAERQFLIDLLSQHRGFKQLAEQIAARKAGNKLTRKQGAKNREADKKNDKKDGGKADRRKDTRQAMAILRSHGKAAQMAKEGRTDAIARLLIADGVRPGIARTAAKRFVKKYEGKYQPGDSNVQPPKDE